MFSEIYHFKITISNTKTETLNVSSVSKLLLIAAYTRSSANAAEPCEHTVT